METKLYLLHLMAGLSAGEESTCGQKQKHETEEKATKAADSLNRSGKARNEVEAYPCYFCMGWHIGRKMSEEELNAYRSL